MRTDRLAYRDNDRTAAVGNPLTVWDLHRLKELDDEGFIDDLRERLSDGSPPRR